MLFTFFTIFTLFTYVTSITTLQVVGRDGSEISAEAREEVMAIGKEAFVQVLFLKTKGL